MFTELLPTVNYSLLMLQPPHSTVDESQYLHKMFVHTIIVYKIGGSSVSWQNLATLKAKLLYRGYIMKEGEGAIEQLLSQWIPASYDNIHVNVTKTNFTNMQNIYKNNNQRNYP